jgi:cytochrome c
MKRTHGILVLLWGIALLGCEGGHTARAEAPATGGNPERGQELIRKVGCGSCHSIPGVRGANGVVAAPLDHFARRTFIGGEVPNSVDNLVQWIQSPESIEPRTAMPHLGLTRHEAQDVAAYLYTLR